MYHQCIRDRSETCLGVFNNLISRHDRGRTSLNVSTILILQCATALGKKFTKSNAGKIYESWPRSQSVLNKMLLGARSKKDVT